MKNKEFNLPPVPAVLLAIISVQCGAAIAKTLFPAIGAAGTASLRIGISAIILIFYLAIERIPIGLAVTLEFIGPLLVAIIGSRRLIDYCWVLLAALGI